MIIVVVVVVVIVTLHRRGTLGSNPLSTPAGEQCCHPRSQLFARTLSLSLPLSTSSYLSSLSPSLLSFPAPLFSSPWTPLSTHPLLPPFLSSTTASPVPLAYPTLVFFFITFPSYFPSFLPSFFPLPPLQPLRENESRTKYENRRIPYTV